MADTLTIDLERLRGNPEQAKVYAGFLLACGGYEESETHAGPELVRSETTQESREEFDTPYTPEAVFGSPNSKLSEVAPSVTIPSEPGVDKEGFPWDARIHSSSKNLNADGTWRQKRGIDDALLNSVRAELRQLMAIPTPDAAVAVPPPPPSVPAAQTPEPMQAATASTAGERQAFIDLIGRTSAALAAHKITEGQVSKVCASVGLVALPMLGMRLDLVPVITPLIDGLIAAQG